MYRSAGGVGKLLKLDLRHQKFKTLRNCADSFDDAEEKQV